MVGLRTRSRAYTKESCMVRWSRACGEYVVNEIQLAVHEDLLDSPD
jgi:hypothetical protein